jgi:predicted acetyltransferase
MNTKLILPDLKYKESFMEMARDLHSEGQWYDPAPEALEKNFTSYLKKLEDAKSGLNLNPDEVPNIDFWILDSDTIVGRLRFNYALSESMKIRGGHIGYAISSRFRGKGLATKALNLALGVARQYRLTEVLLTCDETNLGSIRVIMQNGGEFQDQVLAPNRTVLTNRYLIRL